jgi:hypothetical protein
MPAPRPDYRHGRIIGAYLTSSSGGKKQRHPAVILSPDSAIVQPEDFDPRGGGENLVVVAGISSQYKKYNFPYVQLPYDASNPSGHWQTKLHSDVAVIIGWYHVITIDDDRCYWGGDVPAAIMGRINQAVREDIDLRLAKDVTFLTHLRRLLNE